MLPAVCLAHGSRHPQADATVSAIADATAELTGGEVRAAYLDFSPLTLTAAVELLAAQGHREAVVAPLLFTDAFHMRHDVPEAVADAAAATGVELHTARGIGTGDDLAEIIAGRVRERRPDGGSPDHLILYSVGSSVPGANEGVADFAGSVGRLLGPGAEGADVADVADVADDAVVATGGGGSGDTGPAALEARVLAAVDAGATSVVVEPLFFCPGTLWDLAVSRLETLRGSLPEGVSVTTGDPLSTGIAPVLADRISEATGKEPR